MKKLLILVLLSASSSFAAGAHDFDYEVRENRTAEEKASRECMTSEFSEQNVKEKCTCKRLDEQSSLVKAERSDATKSAKSVLSSCENSGARSAYGWAIQEKDYSTVNWLTRTGQVIMKAGRVVSAGCDASSVVRSAYQALESKNVSFNDREQRIEASKEILGCN